MDELSFHQLWIFCAVARLGSFTRASEELYISQPAVSAQVRSLEAAVGAPLLDRTSRSLRLTEVGAVVHHYAEQIFNLQGAMKGAVEEILGLQAGRLSIASSTTPGDYLLPGLVGQFKARYPGIAVEIKIANTPAIVRQLLHHEVDLGFLGDPIRDEELETVPFRKDEIVAFAKPDHPYACATRVTTCDLEKDGLVLREQGSATRKWAEETLRTLNVSYRVAMELGSNEAVKRAVAAGLGIGMLSRYALDIELESGTLCVANVLGMKCERWLYMAYNKRAHLTAAQRAFMALAVPEGGPDAPIERSRAIPTT